MNPRANRGADRQDLNERAVWLFAAALMAVTLAAGLVLWLLFGYFSTREAAQGQAQFPLGAGRQPRLPPEPRLQANPPADLDRFRAEEDALLQSFGWVDRAAGIARVPIDEAMTLILERGLPARNDE